MKLFAKFAQRTLSLNFNTKVETGTVQIFGLLTLCKEGPTLSTTFAVPLQAILNPEGSEGNIPEPPVDLLIAKINS